MYISIVDYKDIRLLEKVNLAQRCIRSVRALASRHFVLIIGAVLK